MHQLDSMLCQAHELDFRFELRPDGEYFLFVHHGLNLASLPAMFDLSRLGTEFYFLQGAVLSVAVEKNAEAFKARYGLDPETNPRLDLNDLELFLRATEPHQDLECMIVGAPDRLTEPDLQRCSSAIQHAKNRGYAADLWQGSLFTTHDNHFFYLEARSLELLRVLIEQSLLSFFEQFGEVHYAPLPSRLIDVILSDYHTASLICMPTRNRLGTTGVDRAPGDIEIEQTRIQALLHSDKSHWTAYHLECPAHLLNRALLICYDFDKHAWSFDDWT